jgi:broad specificity phosphatase PhoE
MKSKIEISKFIEKLHQDYNVMMGIDNFLAIFRHAEKSTNMKSSDENSITLTQRGEESSREFGKEFINLYQNISFLKSSPIKRCIRTAELFIEGTSKNIKIFLSKNLGDPGVFIENEIVAAKHFKKNKCKNIIQCQINGINLEGIRDIRIGVKMLLEDILLDLKRNEITLYITHDVIMIPFICYLTDNLISLLNWINYLEGFYLWSKNNNIFLLLFGEKYNISKKVEKILNH